MEGRIFLHVKYVNKVCFCLNETPTVLFIYITCLASMHLRLQTPYTDPTLKKLWCGHKARLWKFRQQLYNKHIKICQDANPGSIQTLS